MDGVTFSEPEVAKRQDKRRPSGWHKRSEQDWKASRARLKLKVRKGKPRMLAAPIPVPCPKCYAPMVDRGEGYECEGRYCG